MKLAVDGNKEIAMATSRSVTSENAGPERTPSHLRTFQGKGTSGASAINSKSFLKSALLIRIPSGLEGTALSVTHMLNTHKTKIPTTRLQQQHKGCLLKYIIYKEKKQKACVVYLLVSIWKTQTCQWPSKRRQGSACGQVFCWVTSLGPHISHTAFAALLDFPYRMAARENQRVCWPGVPLWLAGLAQLWLCSLTREPTMGPRKQMHPAGNSKPSQGKPCQMERQTPKLWHLCLGVFQLKVFFF